MHEEITIPELTEVVGRLSALLGPRQGGVALLEGGITNRNFRVNFGGTDYVVRLPGKRTDLLGIDRESERLATKAAAELGIAPRVAAMLDRPACLVTSYIHGREMTAEELRRPEVVETLGGDLRALHGSGTDLPSAFDAFELVQRYARIATEHGVQPPPEFDAALKSARRIEKAVARQPESQPVPCHNDLLTANFLYDGQRVNLIDWEYAGMGNRYFDLGNFAVNNFLSEDDGARLLRSYLGGDPSERQLATLRLFRFVSDFREAMWGTLQSAVSELDFDFEGYARRHSERLAETSSHPDFGRWIDEAGAT